jgi:hypothetical protein
LQITSPAGQHRAIQRQLGQLKRRDLQRKLTAALRKEGQPALTAVRAAWLTVDVESDRGGTAPPDRSTGLRRRTARATRLAVRQTGIQISVDGERVDPAYPSLVMYLNGFPRRRSWRHPVFGNRLVWTAQKGQEVFYPTLNEFRPAWLAGTKRAMAEFVEELERGI